MPALGRSIHVRGKGCAHDTRLGTSISTSLFCLVRTQASERGFVMIDRTGRAPSAFRLNLEQQKNRAKDLLRAAKAGEVDGLERIAAARWPGEAGAPSPHNVPLKLA